MNTSIISSKKILNLIRDHIDLFDPFEHLYLFGSSLSSETINDIDLLVIYKEYSSEINNALTLIVDTLEKASGLPIDLTALSIEEEKDVNFLSKITPRYLKLK